MRFFRRVCTVDPIGQIYKRKGFPYMIDMKRKPMALVAQEVASILAENGVTVADLDDVFARAKGHLMVSINPDALCDGFSDCTGGICVPDQTDNSDGMSDTKAEAASNLEKQIALVNSVVDEHVRQFGEDDYSRKSYSLLEKTQELLSQESASVDEIWGLFKGAMEIASEVKSEIEKAIHNQAGEPV